MGEIEFANFLAGFSPEINHLAVKTRALLQAILPDVNEFVDPLSGIVAYGYSQKYAQLVCAIAPYKGYINLMFSVGARMEDPYGLLLGTGKKARHARINSTADIQHPGIRDLILTAAKLVKSGTASSLPARSYTSFTNTPRGLK